MTTPFHGARKQRRWLKARKCPRGTPSTRAWVPSGCSFAMRSTKPSASGSIRTKVWSRPAWRSAGCAGSSGRHGKPRSSLRCMSTVPAGPRKFSRAGSTGRANSALPDQLYRGRPIDTTSPHVLQQKTVTCASRPSCSHLAGAVVASLPLAFLNLKRSKCRVAFSGCNLRHRLCRSLLDKAISALLYMRNDARNGSKSARNARTIRVIPGPHALRAARIVCTRSDSAGGPPPYAERDRVLEAFCGP